MTLARVYLLTLWFYAGLHKLLSAAFIGADLWTLLALPGEGTPLIRSLLPWLIGGSEITVALLTAIPRTRRLGVAGVVLLHGGIEERSAGDSDADSDTDRDKMGCRRLLPGRQHRQVPLVGAPGLG